MDKCVDKKCPSRKSCLRYMYCSHYPPDHQSYADFNRDEGADKCDDGYLSIEDKP